MSRIMKALGVENTEEWAACAYHRPADENEQACAERQRASSQMLALLASAGFEMNPALLEDIELLVSGRMSHAEYGAYLAEKHKEQGQ